jgi:hypothetical protein
VVAKILNFYITVIYFKKKEPCPLTANLNQIEPFCREPLPDNEYIKKCSFDREMNDD